VSETERLSRLVNQVLDLAKIESGHADWRAERLALQEAIEQAVASTDQLVAEREVRVSLDLWPEPALVWADRDRLVQVMLNLLSNAVKFAPPEDGQVEVRLTPSPPFWRVCVTDNGCGIPEDDLELVFEKFHQAMRGGEKPPGTGLGLPISRQIVEHFGGRIWAQSGSAIGATLCFELPFLTPSATPSHGDGATSGEPHP
jgi:signal transduction histidine kinase